MTNEYINRLDMCRTIITVLDDSLWHPVWKDQPPIVFTQKTTSLKAAITDFAAIAAEQEKIITGHAADKEREEAELEDLSHEIGQALGEYFTDTAQEQNAHAVDFSITSWRRLRDEQLLNRSRILSIKLGQALAAEGPTLASYGLDAEDSASLSQAISDYEAAIATPSNAIANRKAQTAALREKYRNINSLLDSLDKLILRFQSKPNGRNFIATWQAARVIRDRSQPAAPTPPATPPSA